MPLSHGTLAPNPARFGVALAMLVTSAALLFSLIAAPRASAAGEHQHDHAAPVPPTLGDARFMPGTVGPVVFRGLAQTVTVPDGPGFGGEKGRRQSSGDLRKNNYSVTDANYNNVLGLLPRNPDTGQPLTYVQHIQLYAAAGFIEAYAPDMYSHMIMHQNRGEGTVLGAAGHVMGLLRSFDPAAHGLNTATVPATLPGTTIDSRNYVRATRDATGQEWARPHHAQTAPAVFKMLVAAGLTPSIALILASDDGISGAGRLNGMNGQNGDPDGFNSGERATWALAAQVQIQTGLPIVEHLMHGHDHAGIDVSALTKPKVNALIGLAAEDRLATPARAAALHAALVDGRVATAATAAADTNLTVRNEAYLRPQSTLRVDMDTPFDWNQDVGAERAVTVKVENDGPHLVRDVALSVTTTPNVQVVSIVAPAGVHCVLAQAVCHFGDISAAMDDERVITMTVRFTGVGKSKFEAKLSTPTPVAGDDLTDGHENGVHQATKATFGMAARPFGLLSSVCGVSIKKACVVRRTFGAHFVASARPAAYAGKDRRRVQVVFERRIGKVWKLQADQWAQVDARGFVRVRVKAKDKLKLPGVWRAKLKVNEHHLLRGTETSWRYLSVR